MSITSGTPFGHYTIIEAIGAGGMGEVYRARDTQLERDVAIKVLPPSFIEDAGRVARFEQEAKTLASLNHVNIAHIYGIERSSGQLALVMELIDGPTLAERIEQGPLPSDEALGIARQIADGLEAAHARGIVHRDLKPANIKLATDGTVKVLDFGIAKALDTREASGSLTPALTTPAMTEAGIVLGTAQYMSPEQARGKQVDQRADIWAFGCLLFEMLTGQPAFGGEDVTVVLARVLERGAHMDALPAELSPAVKQAIALCLDKDPRKRIADIRDVRLALEGRFGAASPATAVASRRSLPLTAAAFVAVSIAAGLLAWMLKPEPLPEPRPVIRSVHIPPEGQRIPTITQRRIIAISPDGTRFAYNTGGGGVYLRELNALDEVIVSGMSALSTGIAFSADGESLAYWAEGGLRRIAVAGGASVALADTPSPLGISWSGDDTILYGDESDNSIRRVSQNGGEPERLIALETGLVAGHPQRLPYGDWILYVQRANGDDEIVVASPSSGEQRTLLTGATDVRYLPTGHLVYASEGVLYAVAFDAERLAVTGRAVPVVEGVLVSLAGIAQFDVSDTGTLVYVPGPARRLGEELALAVADRAGQVTRADSGPAGPYGTVRASPDGRLLAIDSDDGNEAIVWVYELGSASALRRLTFAGRNRFPVWSPDGERVAFQSDRDGNASIYVQRVDGTGGTQRLTTAADGEAHIPESWSGDGNHLSFSVVKDNVFALWMLSLEDGVAAPFSDVLSTETIGSVFSPDGKWIAYHSLPAGVSGLSTASGVFIEPFPATGARYQAPKVSRDFQPLWSPDGTELYYIGSAASGEHTTVQVSTASGVTFGTPALSRFVVGAERLSGAPRAFDVLPDGRFIGLIADSADTAAQIHIVVNWFEELKRLVPTE